MCVVSLLAGLTFGTVACDGNGSEQGDTHTGDRDTREMDANPGEGTDASDVDGTATDSDDGGNDAVDDTARVDATDGDNDTTDGGANDAGDGSDDVTGGDDVVKTGRVFLRHRPTQDDGVRTDFAASFKVFDTSRDCTTTQEGSCTVRDCASRGGDRMPELKSAGEITVTGGLQDFSETQDTQETGVEGFYRGFELGKTWDGSQTLEISGGGAETDVPSFTGELEPAGQITLTEPSFPNIEEREALTVDTSEGLTVEWKTNDVDRGLVLGTLSSTEDPTLTLTCKWNATSGSGDIPSSLLSEMPAGQGEYRFYGGDRKTLSSGHWSIDLGALGFPEDDDDNPKTSAARGPVMFE